jgi:hypothetical protein
MVSVVRRLTEIVPLRSGRAAWGVILGWAFLASGALAQVPPPAPQTPPGAAQPQPTAPPTVEPTPPAPAPVSPLPPASQPQTQPAGRSGCGGGSPGDVTQNSNAKWVCEETTVTLPAVAAGKSMSFVFNIRNEGTEELKINAKGG